MDRKVTSSRRKHTLSFWYQSREESSAEATPWKLLSRTGMGLREVWVSVAQHTPHPLVPPAPCLLLPQLHPLEATAVSRWEGRRHPKGRVRRFAKTYGVKLKIYIDA